MTVHKAVSQYGCRVKLAQVNLADTPVEGWPAPPPMSTLHALLLFGGVPLLVIVVVWLLVYAPSLARGSRYRPGQDWDGGAEQFGSTPALGTGGTATSRRQLTAAGGDEDSDDTGGASVRW
jgi:hypothetical protein